MPLSMGTVSENYTWFNAFDPFNQKKKNKIQNKSVHFKKWKMKNLHNEQEYLNPKFVLRISGLGTSDNNLEHYVNFVFS